MSATSRVPRVRALETKCVVAMVDALSLLFVNRMRIASDNVFVLWQLRCALSGRFCLSRKRAENGRCIEGPTCTADADCNAGRMWRCPMRRWMQRRETQCGTQVCDGNNGRRAEDQRVIRMMTVSMIDTVPARNAETPVSGTMIAREPVNVPAMDAAQNPKSPGKR